MATGIRSGTSNNALQVNGNDVLIYDAGGNITIPSGSLTPNQTAGIVGTTTNNNAVAGSIGEYGEVTVFSGASITLTSNVAANICSFTLGPGDYDVYGVIGLTIAATTVLTYATSGASLVSGTLSGNLNDVTFYSTSTAFGAQITPQVALITKRMSLASTTTIYLVVQAVFSVSTVYAYGVLQYRRRR